MCGQHRTQIKTKELSLWLPLRSEMSWPEFVFVCFFFLYSVSGAWTSLSCTAMWSARVLKAYFDFEDAKCPQGMQLNVSPQQYIDTSVCAVSLLVVDLVAWEVGGHKLNPGWKFGNRSSGQNISPGCGCLWDSASLVNANVSVCACPAAYRHHAQPRWHLNSSRRLELAENDQSWMQLFHSYKLLHFLWISLSQSQPFQCKSPSLPPFPSSLGPQSHVAQSTFWPLAWQDLLKQKNRLRPRESLD